MSRAVLDVNVIVSSLPARDSAPATVLRFGRMGKYQLISSEHILRGVERAWSKPYFRDRYSEIETRLAIRDIRHRAIMVEPSRIALGVADDLEDDLVLGTAVAGGADYLVTGDRGLLRLEEYRGIVIIPPREFTFELL